uniref:Thymidine kinase n=1 Tax=Physcomitrium patens TaxID=3218 RepID=A0A7I4C4I3_PHYPA
MAAFSSRAAKSLNGGAACRATDRNGNFLEQGREFEGVSSVAPRSVEFLKSTVSHGSNFVRDNVGSIDVIVGPMFAGKTTALLQRVRKEVDAGRKASLVKSDKDNRYAVSAVVSHDGIQMPCVAVPNLAKFRERVGEEAYKQIEVIGIDEAQFFDDLLEFCQSAADVDHKTIIVAGLDGDFLRRRFGFVLDLIPLADSVTKLHARCELCNQPAPFTFRKTVDTETEVIGGVDVYMPDATWDSLRLTIETTYSTVS